MKGKEKKKGKERREKGGERAEGGRKRRETDGEGVEERDREYPSFPS